MFRPWSMLKNLVPTVLAPIFLAISLRIGFSSPIYLLLLLITTGFCVAFGKSRHFMLPRKRTSDGGILVELERDHEGTFIGDDASPFIPNLENRDASSSESSLSKHRDVVAGPTEQSPADCKTTEGYVNFCGSANASSDVSHAPTTALGDSYPVDIDEDLHSRQLAVYGRETMRRLFVSNALVSGMQGLGAEIGADSCNV